MAKFNITYKGLYSFPIYALNVALAVLVDRLDQNYLYDSSYLSGAFILGIPLYYTFINAVQRRSYNRFGYPILALMLTCIGYSGGLEDKSALWLATIPFYYWYVNKSK
jgi:hypothetical protein